ncbi:hypothetical protein HPCPY1662_1545 [Helicobacter pylori CPY1662]|nr:hypothetical protein HPCPY1662_1545 [Helicobacter pylori CPY1662]
MPYIILALPLFLKARGFFRARCFKIRLKTSFSSSIKFPVL